MADPKFRLNQLHGRLGDLVYQFTKVNFSHSPAPDTWSPAVNAYRCPNGFAICVDLAGVQKESIHLEVHQRKVRIGGQRDVRSRRGRTKSRCRFWRWRLMLGGSRVRLCCRRKWKQTR